MKLFIYPYTSGSESAKLLAERLGAKRIKLQNSEYVYDKDNHLVINWGNSNCPYPALNQGDLLKYTVNKLKFFRKMRQSGLSKYIPEYWTHPEDIPHDSAFSGTGVYCRTKVEGLDGAGIVIAKEYSELVDAPLYTQGYYVDQEFRVTFFRGYGITDIQCKRPRQGVAITCHDVKTYANGWGFQRLSIADNTREALYDICEKVVEATGLDFFGLDVIRTNEGRYLVLEANSAMGLEGKALDEFALAVEDYVKRLEEKPSSSQPEVTIIHNEPSDQTILASLIEKKGIQWVVNTAMGTL